MCGIAGALNRAQDGPVLDLGSIAAAMAARLEHRGPDDAGVWTDPAAGVAIAQRRLAVIDLTPEGHQPMISACGRYALVFNGEIYNYPELRDEMAAAGAAFRGHSDTEILLAGISRWGVEAALQRANGMFALAVWDRQQRCLILARDRFGQKPLYYGWHQGNFFFGSELKALSAHPRFVPDIDRDAVALYLRHGWIPAPYTIYRGVQKLPPATILRVGEHDRDHAAGPRPYWSAVDAALDARSNPFTGRLPEATELLDSLLRRAVSQCMISDVPVGAFLSGGVDSSAVVSFMTAVSATPVRTFTIGFRDAQYDEAAYARRIANHLGTDHTEVYLTEADALEVIPRLGLMYDEPFADSSQIPTYLISRVARQHVTVALSGDGGDEVFGGYSRYHWASMIDGGLRALPRSLSAAFAAAARAVRPETWDALADRVMPVLPSRLRYTQVGDKLSKLADLVEARSSDEIYRRLLSIWPNPTEVAPGALEPATVLNKMSEWDDLSLPARMMLIDTILYLPDDILAKVDRASMAESLEVRVPLLDHRIFEFAWRLPDKYRVGTSNGKIVLKEVLGRHVPHTLIERPKMGFAMPIARWLRGELREWAHDLLSSSRLIHDGFLESGPISQCWDEHVAGSRNWQHRLWAVLMFENWMRANQPAAATVPAAS